MMNNYSKGFINKGVLLSVLLASVIPVVLAVIYIDHYDVNRGQKDAYLKYISLSEQTGLNASLKLKDVENKNFSFNLITSMNECSSRVSGIQLSENKSSLKELLINNEKACANSLLKNKFKNSENIAYVKSEIVKLGYSVD